MGITHPHGNPKLSLTQSPWEGGGATNLTEGQSSKIMVLDHRWGMLFPCLSWGATETWGLIWPLD